VEDLPEHSPSAGAARFTAEDIAEMERLYREGASDEETQALIRRIVDRAEAERRKEREN
jgi:hypothetical protein